MTTPAFNGGSFSLTLISSANTTVAPSTVHKKSNRNALSEDERVRLFNLATAKLKTGQFNALPIEISNPKQLSDYHNLDSLIKNFSEVCQTYDMADVFTIFFPDPAAPGTSDVLLEGKVPKEKNLFTEYPTLSPRQVADHCAWLHQWTDDSKDQMHTNLQWTYHALKANIDPELMSRLQ